MNIGSFFTVAGLKAGWAQFLAASLLVKVGVVLAAILTVSLIVFSAYKAYKYFSQSAYDKIPDDSPKAEQAQPDETAKMGGVKKLLNISPIIDGINTKLNSLKTDVSEKFRATQDTHKKAVESLNEKITTLENTNAGYKTQIENLSSGSTKNAQSMQTQMQAQAKQMEELNTKLQACQKALEDQKLKIRAQDADFERIRAGAQSIVLGAQNLAAGFSTLGQNRGAVTGGAANEELDDDQEEASSTGDRVVVPAPAARK